MWAEILPLALTMMVGPQIITAIILVTSENAVPASLAYIAGVALTSTVGTLLFAGLASLFNLSVPGSKEPSQAALWIQTALIILLLIAAFKAYLSRATSSLPKWMSGLQNANPKKAFVIALALIGVMPTDLLAMATVGINLASNQASSIRLLPFIFLTALIAALPLISYLVFRKKATAIMPEVRAWMSSHSWVVSVLTDLLFVYLIWT
jgi:hypothetical protein